MTVAFRIQGIALLQAATNLDTVAAKLMELGYSVQYSTLESLDCGFPHSRARLWIVALRFRHSVSQKRKQEVRNAIADKLTSLKAQLHKIEEFLLEDAWALPVFRSSIVSLDQTQEVAPDHAERKLLKCFC